MQITKQEQSQIWDSGIFFIQLLQKNFTVIELEVKKIKGLEENLQAQQQTLNNYKIEADKQLKTIESQNQIIQILSKSEQENQNNITKFQSSLQFLSEKVDKIKNEQDNQLKNYQISQQNYQTNFEKKLENKLNLIEQELKTFIKQTNEKASQGNFKIIQQQVDQLLDKFNEQDKRMKETLSQISTLENKNQQKNNLYTDFTYQINQQLQKIQDQINNQDQKSANYYQELKNSFQQLQNEQVQNKENDNQQQILIYKSEINDQIANLKSQIEQFRDSSQNNHSTIQKQKNPHKREDVNLQQYQNQNALQQNLDEDNIEQQNNQVQQYDQTLQNEEIKYNQQIQQIYQQKIQKVQKQNEYPLDYKQNEIELDNETDQKQIQIIQEDSNQKIQQEIVVKLNDLLEKLQNNQILELNDKVNQDIATFDQFIYNINEQFKSIQQINISQYNPNGEELNVFSQKIKQIEYKSQQQNLQILTKQYNEFKLNFESLNSEYKQISSKQANAFQLQAYLQKLNNFKQQLNIQKIKKSRDQCEDIIQTVQNLQQELKYYYQNYQQEIVNNEQFQKFTTHLSQQLVNTDIHQLKNQFSQKQQQFMELFESKKKIDEFYQQHQNIMANSQQIQNLQQQINYIIELFSWVGDFPENDYQQKQQQYTHLQQELKVYDQQSLKEIDKNIQLSKQKFDEDIDKQNVQLFQLLQIYRNFDELNTLVTNLYKRLTYTPPDAMITKFIYNLYGKTTYLRAVEYKYKPFVRETEDYNELRINYSLNMQSGKKMKQYCNEIKPVRGDGNCFYTAFGFQFLKYLLLKYNDKEFEQFLNLSQQIKMPMKLYLSENCKEITNKELENKMLIEFFNRLKRLRKIENLKDRLNQFEQEFAAYEQSEDQIEQDGCLYALTTIFLRNYSNYAVDFHEMKDALFDRQNLLIWEKECNNNEIVIDALSRKLNLHSILIFIQKDELIVQQYGDLKYWKVILLMKPGHYNIGVDSAYEEQLIKQTQDEDKKQILNQSRANKY